MNREILEFIRVKDNMKFISLGTPSSSHDWILHTSWGDFLNGYLVGRWSTEVLLTMAPDIIPVYDEDIIEKTLYELPVGYIPSHVKENLPELVKFHVERSGFLAHLQDAADDLYESGTYDECLQFIKKIRDY